MQLGGILTGAHQKHVEEQLAKRRLQMRIPPTFPTLYESVNGENQSRPDHHPKYYARSTKTRPDTGRSGSSRPGPDRRRRGCGSTEHWIRDGKCDARDVAAYLCHVSFRPKIFKKYCMIYILWAMARTRIIMPLHCTAIWIIHLHLWECGDGSESEP
jgi:hypothetical protein